MLKKTNISWNKFECIIVPNSVLLYKLNTFINYNIHDNDNKVLKMSVLSPNLAIYNWHNIATYD